MIGRFILGAGLGAIVGSGVLALVSLTVPANLPAPPAAAPGAVTPDPDPPKASGATLPPGTPEPEPEPEAASEAVAEAPEPAGQKATEVPATGPVPPGSAAMPEPAAVAEPAPADTASVEAVPDTAPGQPAPAVSASSEPTEAAVAEPVVPGAGAAAPAAPLVPAGSAAVPEVGADDAAPAPLPPPPAAPQAPVAEARPLAPAVPAPAPSAVPVADPPAAPPEPGLSAEPAAPGLAAAPAAPAAPPSPAMPAPEAAPAAAAEAGLPPLSPEEEALLAEIAENGPQALPDDLVPVPDPVAEAPAGQGSDPVPEAAGRPGLVVVGEGSTLPSTPALPGSGAGEGGLPQIGAEDPVPSAAPAEPPASTRPLDLYARPFENPSEKPLFAILLIDTGAPDLDRAALAALPFPVTFAVDPQDPQAGAYAATYRATGQEVVMLASAVPKGAKASDVEVAFGVMEQSLPETVAVLDPTGRSFQGDRPLASLVVPVVGAGGRGLVTWNEGLNAADQVARREDVPAAVIFRKLDAEGEDSPVIRRYLDRAAFKAAQEGKVVVAGETRPETVTALLEWAVEGRAATVALAPVTAVLSID
ncbi:divergent polysaccharide deacetylase family protein [Neotabrizicola sp. VNH66]|uniref:divergent polysaccharide deacetylase family protein n=1 Tax=Neotabrizicola sp. VNH66 TaxID=3400918 RepID=UPI003C073CA0